MSARLLVRHLSRLHRQRTIGVRVRSCDANDGEQEQSQEKTDDEDDSPAWLCPQEDYSLFYNPSAYHRPNRTKVDRVESEDELHTAVSLARALRQQSNIYSISSSRHLSISKNTLLDLAFGRNNGVKDKAPALPHPQDVPSDVKVDPRAFQRCRPNYTLFTHDMSLRPPAASSKQAHLILNKVALLKSSMKPGDIAGFLCELGCLPEQQTPLVRGDSRFYMLLRYCVEALQSFTDTQLLDVLRALVLLDLSPNHSMLELFEAECVRRVPNMELHQLLLTADLWRCLGRTATRFLEQMCNHLSPHFEQLGPAELVEMVYVVGEGRRCPPSLIQPLEFLLLRHMEALHLEEVGAVALGLFKSQCGLSTAVVRKLVDCGLAQVHQMSDFALVNIMKLLRFSHLDHLPWLEAMGEEVPRRAPGMGVQGLMHVVLACSSLHYRNNDVLLAVARRLPDVAAHCRSKDICKMLWAFGTLGFHPRQHPTLYSGLTELMRSHKGEFQRYPEHLLTGLLGLAFVGLYPRDMLSLALSPEFVALATAFGASVPSTSGRQELKKDLFTLDGTVALELPQWTGPRLSKALRKEVTQMLWTFAQEDLCCKAEVLEAEETLCELLGGKVYVRKHMILPHTRSIDLEVRLNARGQPVPVVSEEVTSASDPTSQPVVGPWEQSTSGVTLTDDLMAQLTNTRRPLAAQDPSTPPLRHVVVESERGEGVVSVGVDLTEGLLGSLTKPRGQKPQADLARHMPIRIAVQVTNRNHHCYRLPQLLGLYALKRRQLVLAGYQVVEVPHWEWFPLLRRSRQERLAYLHKKIFGVAKN